MCVVTNIFAPYRTPVFTALSRLVDLHVVFCAAMGAGGMPWSRPPLEFAHTFVESARLRGRAARFAGRVNRPAEYYVSPRILTAIAQHRPHAVIAGGYSIPSLYAWIYAAWRGCRRLIFSEGTSRSEAELGTLQRMARRLLLRSADAAIGVSDAAVARFLELGMPANRTFKSPYTTDLSRFEKSRDSARRNQDRCRFAYVGRLVPVKGVDLLLRAFQAARSQCHEIELRIVGTGPEEEGLRDHARRLGVDDGVEFSGFKAQDELAAEYFDTDVFVFPTLLDPFGIAVLEAAAAGLPLIVSPHAGAAGDLVRNGDTGYVVDPMETEELGRVMVHLARNPDLRSRLGAAARKRALARTPERAAAAIHEAVRTAVRNPR